MNRTTATIVSLGSAILAAAALTTPSRAGVVITEIHYNPPAGDESIEFLEVTNDSTTPVDVSGYAFVQGIYFVFPDKTILGPRASLAVCADAGAVKARYGIAEAIGDYTGRLDSSGERIVLVDHSGVVVQNVRYRDRGRWPVGPDGTGHTLMLRSPYLDPAEPGNWTQSPSLGGNPGRANFGGAVEVIEERLIVDRGATWRYAKGTAPFSSPPTEWREPSFVDAAWASGPSGFGYGDGDDATVLADMQNAYTSVAVRKRVALTAGEIAAPGDFYLGMDYDDGFVAYLNGVELARSNAGAPGEDLPHDAVATGSREAGAEDLYRVSPDILLAGENVLAVVGYNFSIGSSDFSLIPRLLHRVTAGGPGESAGGLSLNELFRGATPGAGWVEIHNASRGPIDISGYRLTDDPDRLDPYVLPAGSVLAAGGFLAVGETPSALRLSSSEVHLFLLRPDGLVAAAAVFELPPPPGGGPGGYSEGRFPDGGPLDWVTATPTPAAANRVARTTDVVINEILYNPPDERLGEFLELYNRGASTVDLSGFRFDDGIEYTIPDGTFLGPDRYLVIAEDPSILAESHGLDDALGPWTGRLADSGENVRLVDRAGNPVDEVRYREGGAWPRWADGDGSSLELIDPFQDNSVGSAWEASDETAKAPWERLSFQVTNYVNAAESELHIFLVSRGACLIDDVSIVRGTGANLIPNPGFESGTSPWVMQGTHVASRRITTDARSGGACLELSASGKGDTLQNRIETDTSPRMSAGPYEVSLWARWQRGASLLVAHGEYTAGAYGGRPSPATDLSGNSISAGLRLTIPRNLGTPGAENSVREALRAATGSGNLGPVLADFEHRPASPSASEAVAVTGRVSAAAGVASVTLHWRQGSAAGAFATVDLLDDGRHGDGDAGDGTYGGDIPPQAQAARVVFFVEAVDSLGARRRFPADAPERTLLYQVQGSISSAVETARVVLDTARTSELQNRPLFSNDLLPGTFVFDDDQVYYNVGVRYRGSPWGRPGRNNYRVRLEEDRPFVRGKKALNLDNSGGGPNEGAAFYLIERSGTVGAPVPTPEYAWVQTWFNGSNIGMHGLLESVDRDFVQKRFGDADEALSLKVEGRRQFTDATSLQAWDGCSFIYRGTDKENYRNYFIPSIRRSIDDWSAFVALSRVMDRRITAAAAFDAEIDSVLHVEQFLRALAPRILQADWDAFCVGNGHNGYLLLDPNDGRWKLAPWDSDNTFSSTGINLFPSADPDVARLMSRPWPRRVYYRVLWEYIRNRWSSAGAGPWLDAVQRATGVGTSGIKGFLDTTANTVRSAVQSSTTVAFRILTNAGQDLVTDGVRVEVSGEAPIQVATIFYARGEAGDLVLLEPQWTTQTRWTATLDLPEADNPFEFLGFDERGTQIASTRFRVISLASASGAFVRGDANGDLAVDISDPLATLLYLFGGRALSCLDAADHDDDGVVSVTDAIGTLEFLFRDGPVPRPPYPSLGFDPTADALTCGDPS